MTDQKNHDRYAYATADVKRMATSFIILILLMAGIYAAERRYQFIQSYINLSGFAGAAPVSIPENSR